MVIELWEQLNKDINNDLKQQILLMILESIINDDNLGLISQIAEFTKFFLTKNRNYASRIFNTIIMLAEDEMNHQKFNAAYIKIIVMMMTMNSFLIWFPNYVAWTIGF